jgi:hypothetical protein
MDGQPGCFEGLPNNAVRPFKIADQRDLVPRKLLQIANTTI